VLKTDKNIFLDILLSNFVFWESFLGDDVTKTHEKYVQEVFEYWGNEYEIIGLYSGALSKIKVRHNICGIEWDVIAVSLITGHGCRKCANKNNGKSQRKSHKDFVKDSFKIWGYEYSVLGEYLNTKTKILVKHNKCKNSWDVNPADFLSGHGCPFCDGKRVSDRTDCRLFIRKFQKNGILIKTKKLNHAMYPMAQIRTSGGYVKNVGIHGKRLLT